MSDLAPAPGTRWRFSGEIAGLGTTSGVRVVVGHWRASGLGAFADVMVETDAGHRVLLAPRAEVADFVAATYTFDEVRVEPLECVVATTWVTVASASLRLAAGVGPRTPLGWLLRALPSTVATAPALTLLTDPVARVILPGVRTRGRTRATGGEPGRREWYGATDQRALTSVAGTFDDVALGSLADLDPPARFGFSSAPRTPSLTRLTSTVQRG